MLSSIVVLLDAMQQKPPSSLISDVLLHADLMHVLWEADVAVFKAHITTGPSDKVLDLFWIYDNKKELPENHRSDKIATISEHQAVQHHPHHATAEQKPFWLPHPVLASSCMPYIWSPCVKILPLCEDM